MSFPTSFEFLRRRGRFCLLAAAVLTLERGKAEDSNIAPQVRLTSGIVEGTRQADGIRVFKGIPFAEPPVGKLRWKPPQAVKPWAGMKQTKAFGPSAMQGGAAVLMGVPYQRSEGCLYLNVWAPEKADKLAVMVWIHGGAFQVGSPAQSIYDGTRLAQKGVVVVSIAYRLGAFGFLAHPELSREGAGSSGNYGLLDQIAGLEWVRENIAAFGGDPNCVTIFGESAGGESVSLLAASPKAKALFHRVICESGGVFTPPKTEANELGHLMPTLQVAEKQGVAFLADLKSADIAAARELPAETILKKGGNFLPDYDGEIVPGDLHELYQAGKFNDTPVLAGTNSDDGGMFAMGRARPADFVKEAKGFGEHAERILAVYPHADNTQATRSRKDLVGDGLFRWSTWAWAKLQSEKGKGKAYVYYFDQPAGGAGHAAELAFVFRNFSEGLFRKTSSADLQLSELMSSYWVNFAKTGDPNGPNLPVWSAFTAAKPQLMTFDAHPAMKDVPQMERMQALDAYFAWRRGEAAGK